MSSKYGPILDDFMEEALRIEKAAAEQQIPLRIIGCLAFRLKAPKYKDLHIKMGREVTDIDFISYFAHQKKLVQLFKNDLGYQWIPPGFARASSLRDLFIDPKRGRKIDLFYDHLDFNHNIDFAKKKRLDVDAPTIPLAELFLEKTQILEINAKDLKDLIIMFLAHDVSETHDDSKINGHYIAQLFSDDWAFYYTSTTNVKKLIDFVPSVTELTQEQKDIVIDRVKKLLKLIEETPKTRSWESRAKVGTKKRWYKFVHSMEGTRSAQ